MKNQQVKFISPSELKVSEHYEEVYGKNENIDPLLMETIQKEGIKEPLIITSGNTIVSGVLRWRIAMELSQNPQHQRKFQVVPVIFTESGDSSVEIILHNQGRTKTYSQKLKELKLLKDEFLPGRGFRSDMTVERVKNKEKLEDVLGESNSTLQRLLSIDSNISKACKGNTQEIQKKWELLDNGKLSVTGLYNWVKDALLKNEVSKDREFKEGSITLLNQSCEDLSYLQNKSVNCFLTSPPYYQMATYKNGKDELGQEKDIDTYIKNLAGLLNGVKDKLAENGSVIVNISDAVKKGEHCLIPHRLVVEMNRLGWKVRNSLVWLKTNPPFSGKDVRPNPSHEYIFQFYRSGTPYYDVSWLKEGGNIINHIQYGNEKKGEVNLKSAWHFNIDSDSIETAVNNLTPLKKLFAEQQIKMNHPAMMNDIVAGILLRTFVKRGETVVDVFNGLNTTGLRCKELGINFIGYEINPDFFSQSIRRTKSAKIKNQIVEEIQIAA